MNKPVKIALGLIVLALIILGIAQSQKNKKQENTKTEALTYKIGVIGPLTGDAATYGEPLSNVLSITAEEINASGGINNNKIELIFEDGKCTGKDATNAAQKLVNVDKVQAILGGFCSGESLAAEKVAEASKVVMLSFGSSSPKLTGSSKYFFRNFPSDASQGSLTAEIANKKGYKTVAFIQEQTDYSLGIYQAFNDKFTQLGGKVIKEEFPTGTGDFKSQLTKLRSQNPDALFLDAQSSTGAERILKQMKDLGWKPQMFINEAEAGDTKLIADFKDQLEGAFGAEFSVDTSNTKLQKLIQSYKQKYGADMPYQSYSQTAYDALYIIKDGIAQVGYSGEKLAEWLPTVKDWQGASGKVSLKSDGDRESGYSPEVVKDGKMTPYTE